MYLQCAHTLKETLEVERRILFSSENAQNTAILKVKRLTGIYEARVVEIQYE